MEKREDPAKCVACPAPALTLPGEGRVDYCKSHHEEMLLRIRDAYAKRAREESLGIAKVPRKRTYNRKKAKKEPEPSLADVSDWKRRHRDWTSAS